MQTCVDAFDDTMSVCLSLYTPTYTQTHRDTYDQFIEVSLNYKIQIAICKEFDKYFFMI